MKPYVNNCTECNDTGYTKLNEYCNCDAGIFAESRDELNMQIEYGELDIY